MEKIQNLLLKLSQLLINNNENDLGNLLLELYRESSNYKNQNDVHYFIRKIMDLYGGMGSFNDLVLHQNMRPLKKENDDLDKLREQLYEECIKIRTK